MPHDLDPLIFQRLSRSQRILIAGAGGGFDVYAGLPLAFALRAAGKEVVLANLSFSYLGGTNIEYSAPNIARVTADATGEERYFPERTLARWLRARGERDVVYAFEKVGVRPLTAAYRALVRHENVDALVLVDGGTDILMRGDEAGLGTPEEDMVSLAAAAALDLPVKLLACIGFGVDTFHGVCHAHFLENVAALDRDGGYLGAFSVPRSSPSGAAYVDAVRDAQAHTPSRPSIVNGSIAAAISGDFGDVQFTSRTGGGELFVNPLMSLYFTFEADAVARRSLYLPLLSATDSIFDVSRIIEAFRHTVTTRPRRAIPH